MPPEYPKPEDTHLIERISEAPTDMFVHKWTLWDDNQQHYHICIHASESPFYLRLFWRKNVNSPREEVGLYRLHLKALLAHNYIRPEPVDGSGDELRVRFSRDPNRRICLEIRQGDPVLLIGSVRWPQD